MNYYNENDPYAAQWLRNLIAAGHIPKGHVDDRSIKDVRGSDLAGFTQCHFFAGIAGWSYALNLAGWPEDREVWTGSCPCQPFSVAGKQKGFGDERHLWPEFHRLISERRPATVFGEQVAAASQWLAGVRSDMEALDYALGAIPIEAACAGAPQYRDRIWFVANDTRQLQHGRWHARESWWNEYPDSGHGAMDLPDIQRQSDREIQRSRELGRAGSNAEDNAELLAGDAFGGWRNGRNQDASTPGPQKQDRGLCGPSGICELERPPSLGWGEGFTESEFRSRWFTATVASLPDGSQFIECPDGKYRRLPPPRVRWLGNEIPSRVAKLRAFGNAIVPQVAAEFIAAYLDS